MTQAFRRLAAPIGIGEDLYLLTGVGPALAKAFNDVGVFHFWQIAALTPADIGALEADIAVKGRRDWKGWIKEATEFTKQYPAPADPPAADFSPAHSADAPDAAAAASEAAAAGAGTQSPAFNMSPAQTEPEGAAQSSAAPNGEAQQGELPPATHIDLAVSVANMPNMPAAVRASASLVVKARQDRRRRAGIEFSRGETVVPMRLLNDAQIAAIEGDPVLIVHVRVRNPNAPAS